MTKKNFIALADMIRNDKHRSVWSEYNIHKLADYCQAQNPKFQRALWLGYIAGTNGKNGGREGTRNEPSIRRISKREVH